jgi:hypothetical protein
MTIEEGNKIIGNYEFPNLVDEIKKGDFHNMIDKDKKIKMYLEHYDLLHYEKSWDSIMSVVKKINDTETTEKETEAWYAYNSILIHLSLVDIEKVFEYVVKFIKLKNV